MNSPNKPQKSLAKFKGKKVLAGREDDLEYLIFYSHDDDEGEVVVFVDVKLDLDWEVDGKISKLIDQEPLRESLARIRIEIAALEPIAHNWPCDLKLTTKRLLGEALTSVLRNDNHAATDLALKNAAKYIRAKSRQVSRYWTLQGCLVLGGLAAIAAMVTAWNRVWIANTFSEHLLLLLICFWSGCVGALLFVVLNFGKSPHVDSTAEKHLHYLEAVARIAGGGIAGILVGGLVKLGLVLPVFGQGNMETLAMCMAAMVAGASERLAAGIVTKVENNETSKQENPNGDY